MPRPVLPPNDTARWVEAVTELTGDETAWRRQSEASRAAASAFIARLRASDFEDWLAGLHPFPGARPEPATIESLSPEKRALLLWRLRHRKISS